MLEEIVIKNDGFWKFLGMKKWNYLFLLKTIKILIYIMNNNFILYNYFYLKYQYIDLYNLKTY